MTRNDFKKEINKRLKDDLWDMKVAKNVISKRQSIKSRNIKTISSCIAACFVIAIVSVSLSFKIKPDQDFTVKYNPEQIIIMDDIISFSDENDFDIVFSQDVDTIIEFAMNARL
jgi:hypothetical protein